MSLIKTSVDDAGRYLCADLAPAGLRARLDQLGSLTLSAIVVRRAESTKAIALAMRDQ
jgi:hypothetical protein